MDLLGFGWRPFLHHPDQPGLAQMAADLQQVHAGQYALVAQARLGDPVLYLRLRTYLVQGTGRPARAEGRIDLEHIELRRRILIP